MVLVIDCDDDRAMIDDELMIGVDNGQNYDDDDDEDASVMLITAIKCKTIMPMCKVNLWKLKKSKY